jgi:hypothetical protein
LSASAADALAKPATSPCWLIAIGVFHATPPKLPSDVAMPLSHNTALAALKRPADWSQMPEMPITWPRSLIAVAALVLSLPSGGSSRATVPSGPQTTARNCWVWGAMQVGSIVAF